MTQLVTCLAVLVAMAITGVMTHTDTVVRFHQDEGKHAQQVDFKPGLNDNRGYVKNCGRGGGLFNVSWSPKELDPSKDVQFYVGLVSPMFFDRGRLVGTIYFEDNPILSVDKKIDCQEIAASMANTMPSYALRIDCPIKKGQRFDGYYVFPNTERLIGYDGDYKMTATLESEKGEKLMCMEMDLTILSFPEM